MLLLHQIGSVKVGEVVRYTVTYTPTLDRILPPPPHLYVKIKNTSAIPLRAAYLHGPYTLYVACYPSTFDPNVKHERFHDEGAPDYEPQLKAGGHWSAKLTVPERVREGVELGERDEDGERKSFTWIIEVASQVLFSTTAAVHYELLVSRDKKSLGSGLSGAVQLSSGYGLPGKVEDVQKPQYGTNASAVQLKGVFSKAIRLAVDDTESLWNTPAFPSWNNGVEGSSVNIEEGPKHGDKRDADAKQGSKQQKPKKVHLVVITHGLHSNLGADMLYMKESIDTAAKQAREDAKKAKAETRARQAQEANNFGRDAANLRSTSMPDVSNPPEESSDENQEDDEDDDEEQVIVRGFNGNAVKTERGIQYLGKRLAKYVLSVTYPDQPYHPIKSSISKSITRSLSGQKLSEDPELGPAAEQTHKNSSIIKDDKPQDHDSAYRITSISFISHSLGGLIQTYAIAYIQKHSPEFFQKIAPINFVAMASPFLGLSNENPVYVKFALDFGLVGRTGQDLGLTWRAPTIARSGWSAMVNGLINDPHKDDKQPDPGSKPLLRILPTGPAHQALKMFRNRTVYSNVVNDGIVPLRTSCLLFLDWRGLGRVEKARRENGLVGTMVNWGWSEMTGQNVTNKKGIQWNEIFADNEDDSHSDGEDPGNTVPQAEASQDLDREETIDRTRTARNEKRADSLASGDTGSAHEEEQSTNMLSSLMSFFKPQTVAKSMSTVYKKTPKKAPKMFRRGQVMGGTDDEDASDADRHSAVDSESEKPRGPVRGLSLYADSDGDNLQAPPRTSFFESAGDLLAPPLPPPEFLIDPAARPRTIFHDRVYHPDDIPQPPAKRQRTFMKRTASQDTGVPNVAHEDLNKISSNKAESTEQGTMRIEEKIARAYHKDMAWRKVLVRLEPDAHNNMIVRRMFANAYGWPVVKHLCDTHFAYTLAATTADDDEPTEERAKPENVPVGKDGEEVRGQVERPESKTSTHEDDSIPQHSMTYDPLSNPNGPPDQLHPAQHEELRTMHSRVIQREQNHRRTASEVRESRDHVSDLVTMVNAQGQPSTTYPSTVPRSGGSTSSSHSASAMLNRLHRADSGRWSDRFFEGSDDEDDEDDREYYQELRKARDRGEMVGVDQMYHLRPESDKSPKIPSFPPRSSSRSVPESQILLPDRTGLVEEPDELEDPDSGNCSRDDEPVHGRVTDKHQSEGVSTTGVGLGRSAATRVSEGNRGGHGGEGSIGGGGAGPGSGSGGASMRQVDHRSSPSEQRRQVGHKGFAELVATASRHDDEDDDDKRKD